MTKEMMLEMAKLGGEIFARGTTQNTRRTIYVHVDIYVKAKFSEIELKSFLGRNNYAVQCRYILGRIFFGPVGRYTGYIGQICLQAKARSTRYLVNLHIAFR